MATRTRPTTTRRGRAGTEDVEEGAPPPVPAIATEFNDARSPAWRGFAEASVITAAVRRPRAGIPAPFMETNPVTQPPPDEVAMVRRAAEVLGINHLARWMQSEIPSLGDQTPYSMLKTPEGRSEVERVLLKIEHGVY